MENTPKEIVVTEDEQGTGTVHPMASSQMSSVGRNFGSSPVLSYGVASMKVHEIEPPKLLAWSVGKM